MTTSYKQLDDLAVYVNEITNSPLVGVGCHKIYNQSLVRIINDGGGITVVVSAYNKTKDELYDRIHCFIAGVNYIKRL